MHRHRASLKSGLPSINLRQPSDKTLCLCRSLRITLEVEGTWSACMTMAFPSSDLCVTCVLSVSQPFATNEALFRVFFIFLHPSVASHHLLMSRVCSPLAPSTSCSHSKPLQPEQPLTCASCILLLLLFNVECLCKTGRPRFSVTPHWRDSKADSSPSNGKLHTFLPFFTFQNATTSAWQKRTIATCFPLQLSFLMRSKHLNHGA